MAEGKCFNYGPVGLMRACWAVKCQVNFWPTQKPPSDLEGCVSSFEFYRVLALFSNAESGCSRYDVAVIAEVTQFVLASWQGSSSLCGCY